MRSLLLVGMLVSAASATPRPWMYLTTGNGFGFQVYDLGTRRLSQFLETPYRYVAPGPDLQTLGIERRNLLYDAYFGVRVNNQALWITEVVPSEAGYVEQSHIIRIATPVHGTAVESFFFAPAAFRENAVVMALRVTNHATEAVRLDAFALQNFRLGNERPMPTVEREHIEVRDFYAIERGPGGGAMLYVPLGGTHRWDCAHNAYDQVKAGHDLGNLAACAGNDRTILSQRSFGSVAPGQSVSWGMALIFVADAERAHDVALHFRDFVGQRSAEQVIAAEAAEWERWRVPIPTGLSEEETKVWRQSESVLRMAEVLEPQNAERFSHGLILASLPPGHWHIGWVRDAAYAIVALARMGHYAEARHGLNFFLDATVGDYRSYFNQDYRISVTRYFGDGREESDWDAAGPNVEFDGWGLVLWAARTYLDQSGDLAWLHEATRRGERNLDVLNRLVGDALLALTEPSGLITPDTSIWETHWQRRKHHTFTSLAAARGLCDLSMLAQSGGKDTDAQRYRLGADKIRAAVLEKLVDDGGALVGALETLGTPRSRDAATLEALNWSLVAPSSPIFKATLATLESLRVETLGYMRNQDQLSHYDSNEWIFVDLRAASAFLRAGNRARATELIDWVTAQAVTSDHLLPELINRFADDAPVGGWTGSVPMVGFGAGAYVLTLLDRAGLAVEKVSCAPPPRPAAPPPPPSGPGLFWVLIAALATLPVGAWLRGRQSAR